MSQAKKSRESHEGQEGPKPRSGSARERLLAAAAETFYDFGINATGIDTVIATAGVAKMSLYNNFASKDELVLAYLRARHEEWLGLYRDRLAVTRSPVERVLAVFDAYIDHAEMAYAHGFRGCGILNAAAELPVNSPGRVLVREHKEEVEALLARHIAELKTATAIDVESLSEQLSFLLEGAMARAGLEGNSRRLLQARKLAVRMISAL